MIQATTTTTTKKEKIINIKNNNKKEKEKRKTMTSVVAVAVATAAAEAPKKLWILKEHKLGAYERHTSILTATSDGSKSISQSSPPLDFCKSLTAACEKKGPI
jgi:hypothetical protein